jgi:hypothetical protein
LVRRKALNKSMIREAIYEAAVAVLAEHEPNGCDNSSRNERDVLGVDWLGEYFVLECFKRRAISKE